MWNWIKNLFRSEGKDPHLVLYEDTPEPEVPIHKPDHCATILISCHHVRS